MTDRKGSPEAMKELLAVLESGDDDAFTEADEMGGATDCPEGCYVEPDGTCPHGYVSAMLMLMRQV